MADFIPMSQLRAAIETIDRYLQDTTSTDAMEALIKAQDDIKLAKEIDYAIKTKSEYEDGIDFIGQSHGPARMAIFLLNAFGEFYCNRGKLTIYSDDPYSNPEYPAHINSYVLSLKDYDSHINLYKGNPTPEDYPYDFNAGFIAQLTKYPNQEVEANTTDTSFESFGKTALIVREKGYHFPKRTLDFKSAFWNLETSKDTHRVDYIIQIGFDGILKVYNRYTKEQKDIIFEPGAPGAQNLYNKYMQTLHIVKRLKSHSWDEFILDQSEEQTDNEH